MSDMEARQELLAAAALHEQELERAVVELKQAVRRPFAIGERIGQHPLPWLFGAVLVGLWLGSRNNRGR
jgi:hypothetical protein